MRPGFVIGFLLLAACTSESDETIAVARSAIAGGVLAPNDTAVVGIYADTGATCSGALVSPNVVLTAQHCVAEILGPIDCATSTFAPPYAPSMFYVTTKPVFTASPNDYHGVADVVVPAGGSFCGFDVALLILGAPIPASEAVPLVPRVDQVAASGEQYSAVGFGATDDNGTGVGERRRRDGLVVACSGVGCGSAWVASSEWVGEAGVCGGDSGGPAIDGLDRVIGVASRGSVQCMDPVYGDVAAHADWLKSEVELAAASAGLPAPPWSTGWPTDPAYSFPVGDPCSVARDCDSHLCVDGYCTRPCTDRAPCPEGYVCDDARSVCLAEPGTPGTGGGASSASGGGGSGGAGGGSASTGGGAASAGTGSVPEGDHDTTSDSGCSFGETPSGSRPVSITVLALAFAIASARRSAGGQERGLSLKAMAARSLTQVGKGSPIRA